MHNLLNFLVKNSYWFVFIILQVICFYFIFSDNSYQRSVYLNSSNEVSGRVYAATSSVTSYFKLKDENINLLKHNGSLHNRITALENYIFELEKDSMKTSAFLATDHQNSSEYIVARVVNNSITLAKNYITIDKGSNDSIKVGMGVVSHEGVVGEVRAVSPNFSVIQSLLHTDSKFSTMLLKSKAFSPLIWEGGNPKYATILDYPSHERVAVGDTVITSGFSDIFPPGILVGTVSDFESEDEDANKYKLAIELSTDFNSLKNIMVVKRTYLEEKRELENRLKDAKSK